MAQKSFFIKGFCFIGGFVLAGCFYRSIPRQSHGFGRTLIMTERWMFHRKSHESASVSHVVKSWQCFAASLALQYTLASLYQSASRNHIIDERLSTTQSRKARILRRAEITMCIVLYGNPS